MTAREGFRLGDDVRLILQRLARRLEDFAGGDDEALEGLAEELTEAGFGPEELRLAALVMARCGEEPAVAAAVEMPGKGAQRVPSAEERESVTPEAWGFLIALRQRGALDAGQFERVLDRLMMSGPRPAGLEVAREVAAQVVLNGGGQGGASHENPGGGH